MAQTIPQDKMLHFSACYIISSGSSTLLSYKYSKNKSMWIGFGLGVSVGIAKEIYDINHGHSDMKDIYADILGAAAGAVVVRIRF
jgi:uncharacterized protein YfiM (DUF2279 family)